MAKKFRVHMPVKRKSIPRAVLLAACFLLFSCLIYAREQMSAKKQAEHWVEELYTVSRQLDWEDWISMDREVLYEERFGSRMTESGAEALAQTGLPYVILLQDNGAPVERSHVTEITLEPVTHEDMVAANEPVLGDTQNSGKNSDAPQEVFRYEVRMDVTLEKGIQELAPVVEQKYTGTVVLEKRSFFGWKLDGFTIG